ncbi:MAG: hypothetical protein K9M49_04370, partial [Candidatus Marinimicrobia bacterium]|nr:hypothetical protein [Candidatus Neomarinimicrobiota bacterium]
MKNIFKYLYGLGALVIGIVLSVWIVGNAVSHDTEVEQVAMDAGEFPDYVEMLNNYYTNFDNRSDHFHQTSERHFLPMDEQENCLTCHSIWPHKKEKRTRAFYNQHSRFMTCMVCHMEQEPGRKLTYRWYDFGVDNSLTRNGPYGLVKIGDDDVSGAENFISKITPLVVDGSLNTRVYTPYNTPMYEAYREAVLNGETV